ncbi:MAG: sulfatase-like hydrolase/transferase [Spirochaetota bacterium]
MKTLRIGPVSLLLLFSLLLGALLSVYRWLPDPDTLTLLAPTVESLAILGLIWATSRTSRSLRAAGAIIAHVAIAIVTSSLVLFGAGEAFYQAIFRRGFVPWTDLSFLPALLTMVTGAESFERIGTLLVLLGVLAVVSSLVYVLVRAAAGRFRDARRLESLAVFAMVGILTLASGFTVYQEHRSGPARRALPAPLAVRAARQLSPPDEEITGSSIAGALSLEGGERSARHAFPHLEDRDVHLFIVESYGHTVTSNPDHRELMMPVYERLSRQLQENGYSSHTGFLRSPVFGGRSWLADATMLTGAFLDTQHKYESMVETGSRNLTHILGDAGYHRLLAAPGTYEADEQWRAFHEFDQYLFRYDFGYQGPFISFGAMPDQFLIHRANELADPGDAPLFMNYVLVSSHVPFDRLPQYVDDPSILGDGSIFNELPIRTFENNWLSGGEYPEGYVASIEYTLMTIVSFLADLDSTGLAIIVGDHQPRIPISEPDSSFSVPIHVVSRDPELIEPFRNYGFTSGFVPNDALAGDIDAHPGMDRLLRMFLDVALGITSAYESIER